MVLGNSFPYNEVVFGLEHTGLDDPYGLPRALQQMTQYRVVSIAGFVGPDSRNDHQSKQSALPERAWHITITFVPDAFSLPLMVNATVASVKTCPDSNSNSSSVV